MLRSFHTSVLIVGAGPVRLTLAMELASRGVDVTVTETRRAGEPPNVKCNQVSARTLLRHCDIPAADRCFGSCRPGRAGEKSPAARMLAGLTQADLARAAGCHPRSVRYWENKGSNRTGAQSTWRNSVFDTDTRSPML